VQYKDHRRIKTLTGSSFGPGFYYSDDADLTKPFPFRDEDVQNVSMHCDWSQHLRDFFAKHGLEHACTVLLRGFVSENRVGLLDGQLLRIQLVGRQNNMNPGPRYYGRGLNPSNAAGNDHFYEFIVWKYVDRDPLDAVDGRVSPPIGSALDDHSLPGKRTKIHFGRHVLLRGTIPLHWTSTIPKGLGEAIMTFSTNPIEVMHGTLNYFTELLGNLDGVISHDYVGINSDIPTLNMPKAKVRCVNLLRQTPTADEDVLSHHYVNAIWAVDKEMQRLYGASRVDLCHVDWLNITKDYGNSHGIAALWEVMLPFLQSIEQDVLGSPGSSLPSVATPSTSPPQSLSNCISSGVLSRGGELVFHTVQTKFVRVNCADSLDRTNLGCFFLCVQLLLEILRLLGVPHSEVVPCDDNDGDPGHSSPAMKSTKLSESDLIDDRWDPHGSKYRAPFLPSWAEVLDPAAYPRLCLRALAQLFVENGDMVAMMYTNSAALHTNILRTLAGMKSAASNAVLSAQRRLENVFEDKKKFRALEILLGRNIEFHLPSVSRVFLLRPMPEIFWQFCIVIRSIQCKTTKADVEDAIRSLWRKASTESPMLIENAMRRKSVGAPLSADALLMTVCIEDFPNSEDNQFAASASQVLMEGTPNTVDDDGEDDDFVEVEAVKECIAVVEFDHDICTVVDVTKVFMVIGSVEISSQPLRITRYSYPLERDHEKTIATSAEKVMNKASSSIKAGLKSIWRSLT
jgi:hypothetical protein